MEGILVIAQIYMNCVVAGKIVRTCSDKRRVCFVNDSAVLNEPKIGCIV